MAAVLVALLELFELDTEDPALELELELDVATELLELDELLVVAVVGS
jgi:hypothetical protein